MFFILTVAAAESAIGLAILVVLFRNLTPINVEELDTLQRLRDRPARRCINSLPAGAAGAAGRGRLLAGLFGTCAGRAGAHVVTILGVLVGDGASVAAVPGGHLRSQTLAGTVLTLVQTARLQLALYQSAASLEVGFLIDRADRDDDAGGDLRLADGAHLHHRLHGRRPGYQRFFSYISLFTFSMLMLVMSNNFLQLFFGWEAVGLVSYLLIGFWYTRPTAIFANLKAFLVNRVGDFGFILGIGLVWRIAARSTTRPSSPRPRRWPRRRCRAATGPC